MPANPPILLVDTNVWLDLYLPSRDREGTALRLLQEAHRAGAALAFASQAALDVYQRVCVDNKRWLRAGDALNEKWAIAIKRHAWDCVNEMRELATAVPVDASDLYLACKFRDLHDDFEDDLVLAACERSHANYLVTNDRKLLSHAPIDARTPSQMTELLHAGLAKGTQTEGDPKDSLRWLYQWLATDDAFKAQQNSEGAS